jgi:hypothetical protein
MQPMVYAPAPPPIFRAARKIYPFSIIPGGVYDPKELEKSIQNDPSLAEHYRDIEMENLIAVRTQAPINAYVSFRCDGQICWTKKTLTIPRGELVLTDGQHMIRSRCGNRIQRKRPGDAVSSSAATEQMQDYILDAPMPSIAKLPRYLQPVVSPGEVLGDIWKEPDAEISAVPEPGTLLLFASGILLVSVVTFHRGLDPSCLHAASVVGCFVKPGTEAAGEKPQCRRTMKNTK